jgi:hypothetical protein
VLFGEVLTSLTGAVIFGRHLTQTPYIHKGHSSAIHVVFSIGSLLYGVVMTGCYVVFELGRWRFNEIPIEVPFYRLGNGPFALAVFLVQVSIYDKRGAYFFYRFYVVYTSVYFYP